MFENKIDVDRHVEYCLKRTQSESERNLRSIAFAKLYFNIGEYELARRYTSNYLVVKPKSAEAQLLLGKILEKLGKREAALEAYRTSLDIDSRQSSLVLKVCELLASDDVTLDVTRARFWSEQAQLLDPQHPAVFNLRARLTAADSSSPDEVRRLFITELEHRPTDVPLRVRLLQHMLDYNQLTDAYQHVADIEKKNLSIFADHMIWYETVAKILVRYRNENSSNSSLLNSEFWMLFISVLDKLVTLSLDENLNTSKTLSDCVRNVFNLDQTLFVAAENISASNLEKQFIQEFLIHYRAQLCFHIATLVFKQAKKDQIKYKEAVNLALPLLLLAYHASPLELQCVWLEHASEAIRRQAQQWHRAASFRCSQAGHVLLSLTRERRSTFTDRVQQLCAGAWRERTYKNIFITRDQQLKIKNSYFVTCAQLDEVTARFPDNSELLRYDEVAQLIYPGSLHHLIWIGLNNNLVKFRCTVFEGLQFSVRNLSNCAAETLNILDIQAFLYCCIFCTQASIEESKHLIYYNREKPAVLPASITESYGTLNQVKWFTSVYKTFRNDCGADLSDVRVTLIKGIEIVRCAGAHGLDVKLLVMLANTFVQKAKQLAKQSEIEMTEARADLYWKNALPMLEKLKNNQAISYPSKRWFEYRGKEMTPTEINMNIEEGKLFSATQLMKKKEHEKALQLLTSLKNPYASYYQAQTYKLLADEQISHNKENVTSEMRSQHIILLSKARDCFYLTLDRLREPSVDRKHPLNAELGTEIEKIERLLSRIDPDIVNRNECDGMSDENLSSVDSVGEPTYGMLQTSYHNGTAPATPHHSTMLNSSRRVEARPSPERLDAQLRQMAAAKDATVQHLLDQNRLVMDAHRTLVEELRGFKDAVTGLTASVDDLRTIKKSVDELKIAVDDLQSMKEVVEQVYEIKKDLADLKKDTNKLKSNQINEEDLYALEEEYGVDYNINAANASGFNSAALYPNFSQRLQGAANTLAYGAPGLYPGLYPMYPYGGLGLGQPTTLPFPENHVPDFRTLPQPPLAANMFTQKLPTDTTPSYPKFDTNLSLNTVLQPSVQTPISTVATAAFIPQVPVNKMPPVNVVITASDPLPTTSAAQPVLSVTIPPQHLKGNHQPKILPHNYQIPMPVTTQSIFSNVPSVTTTTPLPVSTQNLLSNVAPPVYSSLTVKSPNQSANTSSKDLGLHIEKSLAQSFISSPITTQKSDLNKSNVSEGSVLEEHDPCPDFKPIIPLPDEVPLTTGEENEKILFCAHAKLYRFVDKEWRERGVGDIKILYNENTNKVRILMRRDQVHKICANHFLTPDIHLTQMQKNERAYIWAANDFADENVVLEKLCVRFKSAEEGKKFAEVFEHGKTILKSTKIDENKPKIEIKMKPQNKPNTENLLGGFVFTSTPTFKPKTDTKPETPSIQTSDIGAKSSPFAGFTFNTPKSIVEFTPVQKVDVASIQSESVISPKPVMKQSNTDEKEDDEDFVPSTEFKPVIPLPDLVEVKTGEESSEVLFEVKAKLLRFDSSAKEWKERGVGIMKILKDKTIRLLMRREQVHKICCNHQLLKSMVFTNMPKNSRVLNWCAQDFSENVLKTEMFAIRFRTEEQCEEFLKIIHEAQDMLDSSNNVCDSTIETEIKHSAPSGWGDKFKPKDGSWECSTCYVSNTDNNKCVACGSVRDNDDSSNHDNAQSPQKFKPSPAPTTPTWSDKSKPKVGTWQCKICFIHNDGKHNYCEACDSPKNDTVPRKDSSVDLNASGQQFSFGISSPNFGSPATSNTTETTPSASLPTSGWGDLYKPKAGTWECKACYITNNASTQYCVACDNPKDDTVPKKENKGLDLGIGTEQKFNFGIPISAKPTNESVFTGFNFGLSQVSSPAMATGFSFGGQKPISTTDTPSPLAKTTFSFTFNKPTEPKKDEFVFGSPNKHDFEFKPRSPRKVSGGDGDGESDVSGDEEECDNIYFKPVIPLPDKVEVRTGEEDEIVLYCHRAKLFKFTNSEWKERGIGEVKILQHPATAKLRVLMRREQVHKICLNHCLTKDVEYKAKDDHTWLFSVADYSEGEIEYQQFCLRFKNADIAKEFMIAVDKARNESEKTASIPDDTSSPDLEIVYEMKVPSELQEKALKLQLPKNFYAYLQKEPCKGCIGCNDDNFVFSTSKPKIEASPATVVKSENSVFNSTQKKNTQISFFGTPEMSIFGTPNASSFFGTPESTSASFSFLAPNKTFSSPFTETITTPTTDSSFTLTSPSNIFGSGNSIVVGSTTITPVKNNAPTLTSLLISSQSQNSPTTQSEHRSPLAPSKLANTFTANIFSGAAPNSTTNIFGNTPSTPPLSQMLSASKTGGNVSIFSGTKSETALKTEGTPLFGSQISNSTTNIFGNTGRESIFGASSQPSFSFSFSQAEKQPTYGNLQTTPSFETVLLQQSKEAEPVLKCDTNLSFAALASGSQTFATENKDEIKPFSFAGTGSLVFGTKKQNSENKNVTEKSTDKSLNKSEKKEETDEEETKDAEHGDDYDPHYEPIVPLPEAIVVKTGEEDETIVFNERAKLYRYNADTKEWKERGVGQMKILHHPVHDTYRLLMRREQVHKLVLNQLLTVDIKFQPMQTSDRAWCWAGYNHSEEGSELEELAIRFKNPELAKKFHDAVATAQEYLSTKPQSSATELTEEDEPDDEYGSDDSDENKTIMFSKRCTLSYKPDKVETSEWKTLGMGVIKILYDSELYGARIEMFGDSGEQLSNTIIAINTIMKIEDTCCIWRSMEWNLEAPEPRILKAQFSSAAAAQEMYYNYEESLQYAQNSEIVDNLPE